MELDHYYSSQWILKTLIIFNKLSSHCIFSPLTPSLSCLPISSASAYIFVPSRFLIFPSPYFFSFSSSSYFIKLPFFKCLYSYFMFLALNLNSKHLCFVKIAQESSCSVYVTLHRKTFSLAHHWTNSIFSGPLWQHYLLHILLIPWR